MLPHQPTTQAMARYLAKQKVLVALNRPAHDHEGDLQPSDAWHGASAGLLRANEHRQSLDEIVREAARKTENHRSDDSDGAFFTPRFYQDALGNALPKSYDGADSPRATKGASARTPRASKEASAPTGFKSEGKGLEEDDDLPVTWDEFEMQHWQSDPLLGGADNVDDQFVEVTCGMTKSSPARKTAIRLLKNRYFEFTVMTAVVANTVILACTPPSNDGSMRDNVAKYAEVVFTMLFTVEMGIKVFALGFNQYIKSGYNMLDFTVVVSGWLPIIIGMSGNLAALRVLRVLRSLRTMSVFKGVRMMLENTLNAATQVLYVFPLASFVFTIYGVMGVQLFMGSLRRRCMHIETNEELPSSTYLEIQTCSLVEHTVWGGYRCPTNYTCQGGHPNPYEGVVSFDNAFRASVTIFQIITLEAWTDVMYLIQDATTGWACFYFLSIVVVGAFFLMNLVLAVITDVFTRSVVEEIEEEPDVPDAKSPRKIFIHAAAAAESMRDWVFSNVPRCLAPLKHLVPGFIKEKWTRWALMYEKVLVHQRFELWLVLMIITNTIILSMEYDGMSKEYGDTLEIVNFVFVIIFAVETFARFIVLGPKKFAKNRFNIFDAFVVILSILGYVNVGTQFTAFRGFRVFHLLRLIRSWKRMQLYAVLIGQMLYKLLDFVLFLSIALVVFTITGMQLFGGEYGSGNDRPRRHFDSFLEALLTVFQVFTGENWNSLMYTGVHYIGWGAAVYFILLMCVGTYFIVNVFLGILLANFAAAESFRDLSGAVTAIPGLNEALAALDNALEEHGGGKDMNRPVDHDARPPETTADKASPPADPDRPLRSFGGKAADDSDRVENKAPDVTLSDSNKVAVSWAGAPPPEQSMVPGMPTQTPLRSNSWVKFRYLTHVMGSGSGAIPTKGEGEGEGSDFPPSDPGDLSPRDRKSRKAVAAVIGAGVADAASQRGAAFLDFKDLVMTSDLMLKDRGFHNNLHQSAVSDPSLSPLGLPSPAKSPSSILQQGQVAPSSSALPNQAGLSGQNPSHENWPGGQDLPHDVEQQHFLPRPPSLTKRGMFTVDPKQGLFTGLIYKLRRLTSQGAPSRRVGGGVDVGDSKEGTMSASASASTQAPFSSVEGDQVTGAEKNQDVGKQIAAPEKGEPRKMGLLEKLIKHPWFEHAVLLLIFFSSILLAVESPGVEDHNPRLNRFLGVMEIIFATTFSVEILTKIYVMGPWKGKDGYFRDPFNIIDSVVVILSVLAIVVSNQIRSIRSLRVVRVLRPLRVISRLPEVKVVVQALLRSFPAVINLLFLDLVFFVTYGILGMKLFSGKFKYCTDKEVPNYMSCQGTFQVPGPNGTFVEEERVWVESKSNFDNIFYALITLFHMSTTEGWADVMELGMKCANKRHPEDNCMGGTSFFITLYFIFFMLLSSFILVNMFIGVVVDSFLSANSRQTGSSQMLTDGQHKWLQLQKVVLSAGAARRPVMPRNTVRAYFFRLVNTTGFKVGTMLVIVINTVFLMLRYAGMSETWADMLDIVDQVCTYIFLAELLCKMAAFFPHVFFSSLWRCFDFVLVISSLFANVNVLRVFRIARIARMVPYFPSLLILLQTLVYAAPSMMNVGSLLFMVFYIYATMGVALFGRVEINGMLDRHANFKNFGRSMLTLARISTGESWHEIMYALMVRPPDCGDSGPSTDPEANSCGNPYFPPFYFISFVIFGCFIFLNMFIAVILESFDYTKLDMQDASLPPGTVQRFMATWSKMDPHATGFIPVTQLHVLFRQMEPPLRYPAHVLRSRLAMMKMYKDLPTTKYGVFFTDVFRMLASYAVGTKEKQLDELPGELSKDLERDFMKARQRKLKKLRFRSREVRDTQANDCLNPLQLQQETVPAEVMEGVITLQARVKGFLVRKNLRDMLEMETARIRISSELDIVDELILGLEKLQASEGSPKDIFAWSSRPDASDT